MWPGFESWRRCLMWVEFFVVGSLPCSERFFSGYSGFFPLLKNQHFQIPIRSGTHGHVSTSSYELLSDPWVNKLQFTIWYRMENFLSCLVFSTKQDERSRVPQGNYPTYKSNSVTHWKKLFVEQSIHIWFSWWFWWWVRNCHPNLKLAEFKGRMSHWRHHFRIPDQL